MKALNIILRVLLGLLLVTPILGAFGIFPAPTPDLYNNPQAFAFIDMLFQTKYVMYMMSVVFAISLVLIIMNRMALAALLLLPISLNIIAFHAILDGGLFTAGAIMGNVLFLLNIYFLWRNRDAYRDLLDKSSN
jgi:putative oxidoreductase